MIGSPHHRHGWGSDRDRDGIGRHMLVVNWGSSRSHRLGNAKAASSGPVDVPWSDSPSIEWGRVGHALRGLGGSYRPVTHMTPNSNVGVAKSLRCVRENPVSGQQECGPVSYTH